MERDAPAVSVRNVTKRFSGVVAVDEVSLDVEAGEFFSMLGPSGSGKTTVLRLIAGFEPPTEGSIRLGGDDVTERPPYARDGRDGTGENSDRHATGLRNRAYRDGKVSAYPPFIQWRG